MLRISRDYIIFNLKNPICENRSDFLNWKCSYHFLMYLEKNIQIIDFQTQNITNIIKNLLVNF
ncbi:hypothetical protein EAH81_22780 [Flavobacterium pectinovorum]|uniref:Uncharacterized protein n=1 Tax=Flavobacterium pectinovorum TaxID=29533 RepID=A0A502ECC0_9FLAO|nr:hypothetical protein EAH81_22780 [Flavobacterium pectinovorum]